jgi:thioester reductase-like protein
MAKSERDAVVLTGATGFLGRELLFKLMQGLPPEVDIVCLVRGGREESARVGAQAAAARRLEDLLGDGAPCPIDDPRRLRVSALAGDITLPHLGLSEGELAALAARTTEIFHGAATVRFDLPLDEARRVNVEGTRAVLLLAVAAQKAGRSGRLHYVGTAYVAGNRTGLVREEELAAGQSFNNTYEQTKYEAEALVRDYMNGQRGRLPATIYRPSIIVGDSKSGQTSSFKVMYWPLKVFSRGLIPIVPASRDSIADLIPVDYVVDSIWALSRSPHSIGRTYHLAAGPEHSITIGEAIDLAADFFHIYKPLFVSTEKFERFVRPILKVVLRGKRRLALDAGRVYVPYLNYRASFDTSNARRDLAGAGLHIPDARDYFHTLMRYCIESDWGKRPVPPRL